METRAARPWMLTGVALILLVGLIHLMDAPDSMTESTTKGLFFYANFVGAVSRTVGIFGLPPDVWMEPLGIASLVVEALFIAVALRAFTGSRQESPERGA